MLVYVFKKKYIGSINLGGGCISFWILLQILGETNRHVWNGGGTQEGHNIVPAPAEWLQGFISFHQTTTQPSTSRLMHGIGRDEYLQKVLLPNYLRMICEFMNLFMVGLEVTKSLQKIWQVSSLELRFHIPTILH